MGRVQGEERFVVCDDWLVPADLSRLRSFLGGYRYFTVTSEGKRGADGTLAELSQSLNAGRVKLLAGPFVVKTLEGPPPKDKIVYPSQTPLDAVLDSVEARLSELAPWLGRLGEDWARLGCGPKLYAPGFGMERHDDARFAGTFVLYVHEEWRPDWGGELSFEGGPTIEPRPNRCVFVKAGAPHEVRPVAPGVGAPLRTSVIGYTFRPKR